MADSTASAIMNEALSLRASHPNAPASDMLDLVMQGRHHRHYDFGLDMLPPAPFAYLVAEAVGDLMSQWEGVCRQLDPAGLAQMRVTYIVDAWLKFLKRYNLG